MVAYRLLCTLYGVMFICSCNVNRDKSNPETMEGKTITITGVAQNGKDGALIKTDDQKVFYVEGLASWDDAVHGKRVEVTGLLKTESFKEENLKNEKGEWAAGIEREKKILRKANWKILQK